MSAAPLKVLYATSELAPLVKTGGLGDVSAALPAALAAAGVDVRLLLPGYPALLAALPAARRVARIAPYAALPEATLRAGRLDSGVPVFLVDCPELYARPGNPYLDASGADWPDNARRYGLLSCAAAVLARRGSALRWWPDIVHAHDWQTGLAPAYLALGDGPGRAASVFTVHNLGFPGSFGRAALAELGLPAVAWSMHGVEFHGQLSFLKAGLYYADRITTVSPTYAREIQREPLGFGLHGLLAARGADLEGIVNGIDERVWDPSTDPHLPARYSRDDLAGKAHCKAELLREFALSAEPERPLAGVVSRLTGQKGIDLVLDAAASLLADPAAPLRFAMLGSGEAALVARARALAARHPDAFAFREGFDEALAHRIEAGADLFLMPSRFEPCGLNQMYSQRYGTPPVVHATGGLADTVVDCTPETLADGSAGGFVFGEPTVAALLAALHRARSVLARPDDWRRLQRSAMAKDFGWARSAARYLELYRRLRARAPAP